MMALPYEPMFLNVFWREETSSGSWLRSLHSAAVSLRVCKF